MTETAVQCATPTESYGNFGLMEGLWGTAIRSAVRDPSCPQAPVLPRARRHPGLVRGCPCRWLRPRPPIPARMFTAGDAGRRVAHHPAAVSAGAPISIQGSRPWGPPGVTGTSHNARSCRSAPGHPPRHERRRHDSGRQAPQSSASARGPVPSGGGLPCAHQGTTPTLPTFTLWLSVDYRSDDPALTETSVAPSPLVRASGRRAAISPHGGRDRVPSGWSGGPGPAAMALRAAGLVSGELPLTSAGRPGYPGDRPCQPTRRQTPHDIRMAGAPPPWN